MDKIIDILARVISGLTFPLLMPTYAMLITFTASYLRLLPGNPVLTVLLVTIGITLMLPIIVIYVLHATGKIADPLLNNRRERTIPFAVAVLAYLAMSWYMWHVHAPGWVTAFMLGAAALVAVVLLINLVWKISGHAAGMGGLTALATFLTYRGYTLETGLWLPITIILASGIVCTCRLLLNRHSVLQVAAGYFLAFAVIYSSLLVATD